MYLRNAFVGKGLQYVQYYCAINIVQCVRSILIEELVRFTSSNFSLPNIEQVFSSIVLFKVVVLVAS